MFGEIRTQFFPFELDEGITAEAVNSQTLNAIWSVFDQAFHDDLMVSFRTPPEREAQQTPLKRAFASAHHERFIFYTQNRQIAGWSWGDMRDTESFFMTNSGILPAYRQRGIYSAFLKQFIAYLTACGYERIVSAHQINNRPILIAKLKAGFTVTGFDLDERWGAQVVLTYFTHIDRTQGFEKAFAMEPRG